MDRIVEVDGLARPSWTTRFGRWLYSMASKNPSSSSVRFILHGRNFSIFSFDQGSLRSTEESAMLVGLDFVSHVTLLPLRT